MTEDSKSQWPREAWYAAAWDHEIGRKLTARKICDHDVVMYRRLDGRVCTLENACWHRLLPLSMGRLDGDEVTCGYHGLVFDASGRCTHMPSQDTINPSACVRTYPTVERHRFVWIWTGDPARADPALVPDLHWNDDPDWAGDGKVIHVKCDYRLVLDNLMDLTHETFVHSSSIGDRAVAEAPFEVTHGDTAAPASSIAGRSSASRHRRRSPSTSAWPRPAPAPRTATVPRASTATCSTRSRRRATAPAITSGPSRATTICAIRSAPRICARASRASSARTNWFSRRSSGRSTRGPTSASSTSTSTPDRCGRGA